jgi:hypothetical protein
MSGVLHLFLGAPLGSQGVLQGSRFLLSLFEDSVYDLNTVM